MGLSKKVLSESSSGSNDIESYIKHFEWVAHLQKLRSAETHDGNEVKGD